VATAVTSTVAVVTAANALFAGLSTVALPRDRDGSP
jgi:hypothetical protein